ncbi:ABC2 membrane and/or AAA 21 domain containing protein, partial [Asbolus verrucosus]
MLSYIMQDDIIQPFLTVKEAMVYAAHFKMGANVKVADRIAVIEEVVDFLGLEKCVNTYSQYLSGGERKRLNIALELINNPPVIFLDEPTTGLDDFAVRQCVDLLKKISKLDRTVVCTIHQPQASLFQVFDRVYIIADGYCVYNGSPAQMVPFFSLASYTCPSNNTPAEYILLPVIELVHSDPSIINCFKDLIQNGKISMNETVDSDTILETFNNEVVIQNNDTDFPTSFYVQLFYLMSRRFLQMKRNRIGLYIQFFNHLLLGFAIAGLYGATGNNAKHTFTIFKYCICCNVFLMFTYMMTPVLLFPLEVVLLKREHFNRWYSLKAFYSALFFSSLPLFITLGSMFIGIVYFLTDQPKEVDRFLGFYLTCFAIALTAQGLGYLVGSVCRITSGSIIVSLVMAPLVLLSYYGIDNGSNIQSFYRFLMTLSFMRHGVIGLCNALFYQRKPLTCYDDEVYCHYARPDVLMRDMSMPLTHYKYQLGHIFIF